GGGVEMERAVRRGACKALGVDAESRPVGGDGLPRGLRERRRSLDGDAVERAACAPRYGRASADRLPEIDADRVQVRGSVERQPDLTAFEVHLAGGIETHTHLVSLHPERAQLEGLPVQADTRVRPFDGNPAYRRAGDDDLRLRATAHRIRTAPGDPDLSPRRTPDRGREQIEPRDGVAAARAVAWLASERDPRTERRLALG